MFFFTADVRGSYALPSQTSSDLFDELSGPTRKTPESFLGPNAALVNLDSLVTKPLQQAPISNPFLAGGNLKQLHISRRSLVHLQGSLNLFIVLKE